MTVESEKDLAGLRRAGRVVALASFAILSGLSGHGVGRSIHEPPTIPNRFDRRLGSLLTEGLVITIEPIITSGMDSIVEGPDGWTITTADGSPAAHHEHTIVVTKGSPIVLTAA